MTRVESIASMPRTAHSRRESSARPVGAYTLLECLMGMAMLSLVLLMAWSFQAGTSFNTARTGEDAGALRSVMVGMEHMRRDLEQMLYQCPQRDLALLSHPELGDNRGLSLRVPDLTGAANPWSAEHATVTYSLRRVAGSAHAYQLVRANSKTGEESVIRNCLFRDMVAHLVPCKSAAATGLSSYQAYLDVTLIGLGSETGTATYTSSMLIPLPLMGPAGAYDLRIPSRSR